MEDIFKFFYKNNIKKIHDFLNSKSNILFVNGYYGSGKSSAVELAIKSYEKSILKFSHLCFTGTLIEDFLISFYDNFRTLAISGEITLKANPEEGLVERVNFYFKNLEHQSVVVIENFEETKNNSVILDFLIHISGFENVKVIIISKDVNCPLIQYENALYTILTFDKPDEKSFKELFFNSFKDANEELFKGFYEITEGYELYSKMAINYLENSNISLSDFISEFERKRLSFDEFMIEKQISLIPNSYYPLLKSLSCLNHGISAKFIEAYNFGDIKELPYLISKFVVSDFGGIYHIKSYIRDYFFDSVSIQDKISMLQGIISIYEKELEKSPKDRILRLSRESIRHQIELVKNKIPRVEKVVSIPAFNYMAQVMKSNPQWFITEQIQKKESKKAPIEKEIKKEPDISPLYKELSKTDEIIKEYNYKEALIELVKIKPLAKTFQEKKDVYSKIVECAIKSGETTVALNNLKEAENVFYNEGETDSYARCKIEAGKIYKKLYSFLKAKECFFEVEKIKDKIQNLTYADCSLEMAEIYEDEGNYNLSVEKYKEAFDLISKENKTENLDKISFSLASLYNDSGDYENALIEYENAVKYSIINSNTKYLVKSYSTLGSLYIESGDDNKALEFLYKAYELEADTDNYLDTYYILRSIAEIYKNKNQDTAYEYLTTALEYAKMSEHSFEIAIALLELGDFYYELKQNEQALICYFQAKNQLGENTKKENLERINTRINDMKIKLGEYVFKGMQALYDTK